MANPDSTKLIACYLCTGYKNMFIHSSGTLSCQLLLKFLLGTVYSMICLWFLILFLICKSSAVELDGLDFKDNQMKTAWVEENGRTFFNLPYFPKQFSFCSKIFAEFERYNTYSGLFYIFEQSNNLVHINVELSSSRDYNLLYESRSSELKAEWLFGEEEIKSNLLQKWTWFCVSVDYNEGGTSFSSLLVQHYCNFQDHLLLQQ